MITSNSFFPRHPLFSHEQQPNTHPSTTNEMGPWNSLAFPTHSQQIPHQKLPTDKTNKYGSIMARYRSKSVLECVADSDEKVRQNNTIDGWECKIFRKSINQPQLKRASHLPVISAREEYGDIFKYTRPLGSHEVSVRSMDRSNSNGCKNGKKKKSMRGGESKGRRYQQKCRGQLLPSIDKYLWDGSYNIYERCLVKTNNTRQLTNKLKSNNYHHRLF